MMVWLPMLDDDERPEAVAAANDLYGDLPLIQFWDGTQLLGKTVGQSVGAGGWIAWDIYLFYPPGVEWTGALLPPPEVAIAQANGVVVGSPGSLPASADQSHAPAEMQGHAVVVGDQDHFEALIRQVAEPFAKRYAKP